MTEIKALGRTLEVAASLEALRPVGEWLRDAAAEAGLPEDAASALDHALHEAVENVVRYAWADPAGRRFRVGFRCDRHRAEVEVEDEGRPFDPRTVPPPQAPASIEHLVPGGYGVAMMRRFVDEIQYRRDGSYNRLTLVRRLNTGSAENH